MMNRMLGRSAAAARLRPVPRLRRATSVSSVVRSIARNSLWLKQATYRAKAGRQRTPKGFSGHSPGLPYSATLGGGVTPSAYPAGVEEAVTTHLFNSFGV